MKGKIIFLLLIIVVFILGVYKIIDSIKTNSTKTITIKEKRNGKNLTISIIKEEQYLHEFKVNSVITIKTPPQFAVWIEDINGNYIETLYATSKIVKQNWSKAPGDSAAKGQIQRKEALPYWDNKRSKNSSNIDAVSSATPKGSSVIKTETSKERGKYVICAEFNNSTDFNQYYTKDALPEQDNYSGGAWGSGQPSIIYKANIDLDSIDKVYQLKAVGHGSPSGKDGNLYEDMSKLTTAKHIVKSIDVSIK
ncbi:DUF2271 domain-containing protein [Clostridium sp. DJ247]|uniref:DUF2271 domain-containing protein n=1 Tax=Clostridium sp. DJ247 TaxID=2726188 RepID=UPI001629479C|nr:DUF2271 domain-containing protein [Clostridium sp. DJ247]MBC2582671.1 DUF2271 domain-containing protein [Clostridium sp. DJ247]